MDKLLATKIYNVMIATEGLTKDMSVGKKGGVNTYAAVSEKAVLNMIKPLLVKEKLICIPKDGDITENTVTYIDGYGKNKFRGITQLKIYFMLVDVETGESVDIVGFGNGADSQDKGSGKAFTYAYKTALQKTFCMFSGEDTDSTHSDDISKSESDEAKVTTQMLSDAIKEADKTDEEYITWYNKKHKKNISELKFMAQDTKQAIYKKLKEGK